MKFGVIKLMQTAIDKKLYMKEWYKNNKEKAHAIARKYRQSEKAKAVHLLWQKKDRRDNPERHKEYARKYNSKKEKQELANIRQKKWREKHPEYMRASNHNRIMRTKDLTIEIIQRVYEENIKKHGTLTCYLCLIPIGFGDDCLEHKTPLSRGGNNQRDNLDIAHASCNRKKHSKTEQEYLLSAQANKDK